jgi:hypothetical protein
MKNIFRQIQLYAVLTHEIETISIDQFPTSHVFENAYILFWHQTIQQSTI